MLCRFKQPEAIDEMTQIFKIKMQVALVKVIGLVRTILI
jgi:hypothetical protein